MSASTFAWEDKANGFVRASSADATIADGEKALHDIGVKASDRRRVGFWLLRPDRITERPCVQTRGLVVLGSTGDGQPAPVLGSGDWPAITDAWITNRHRHHAPTGTDAFAAQGPPT